MFPCCSTREDLSIDVTITNAGLILTKQRRIQLFKLQHKSKFEFRTFFEKKNFRIPWCRTREDLSIDVSISYYCRTDIDKAKVISALRHKLKFKFQTFLKKIKIFGFLCCS